MDPHAQPQSPAARVRPRTDADLPRLVEVLTAQQAASHYPVRWPLPFPVERFIVRTYEETAWVAELDGVVVGHVMVGRVEGEELAAFVEALGTDRIRSVSVLFVEESTRGTGVGGLLLDTAVAAIRARGLRPVLDVVAVHDDAVRLYRRRGWVTVGAIGVPWMSDQLALMTLPDPVAPSRG